MSRPHPALLTIICALGLGGCSAPLSREPQNLTTAKTAVIEYVDSGAYEKEIALAAAPAKTWVATRAQKNPGEKTAIVFDIDETSLSNFEHMKAADWGYQPAAWNAWVAKAAAPAIAPVREIYQTARSNNVAVIFLTGRKEVDRAATARNLRAQGMGDYAALIVRPNGPSNSATTFKTAERQRLTREGYTIIANIGDQQTDLEGGYAERTFKLPNPFYLIP